MKIICCILVVALILNGCYLTNDIIDISSDKKGNIDSFLILLTPLTALLDILFSPFTFPEFLFDGFKEGNWHFFQRPKE